MLLDTPLGLNEMHMIYLYMGYWLVTAVPLSLCHQSDEVRALPLLCGIYLPPMLLIIILQFCFYVVWSFS